MNQQINCEQRGFGVRHGMAIGYDLILAAQGGDRAAFEELVRNYEGMVIRVALNVTGSEDAAQQIYTKVFADAFLSVKQLHSGSSVFLWLYRILVRHCLEHCRRHPDATGAVAFENNFEFRLRTALGSLPPIERVILQLKHYHHLKIRTLAEILDASPEFVIKRLQSATVRLRKELKADVRPLYKPSNLRRS